MGDEREVVRNELENIHADGWGNTLDELISHLRAIRESAPAEWQSAIEIEFEYDSYDGGTGWLEIYYNCPETDAQMAERIANPESYEREARERD